MARGLASAGAEVVVISRSGGAETVKLILEDGNKAYDIKADVTDEKSVDGQWRRLKREAAVFMYCLTMPASAFTKAPLRPA